MLKRLIALSVLLAILVMLGTCLNKTDTPETRSDKTVVLNTAYEEGRMAGHYAFLKQAGEYIPMQKSARYSSDVGDEKEEFNKGYVDGYHRAAESLHCPR